jgi:hypothetical protein
MSLCHFRFLLEARETAARIVLCERAKTSEFRNAESPQAALNTPKRIRGDGTVPGQFHDAARTQTEEDCSPLSVNQRLPVAAPAEFDR